MACRIPARANGVPERQARRPGPPGHFVPGATSHMLDWFKLPARRGIYQLYEERYQAQQAATSQTPKLPPLSMLLRFSFGGNQAVGTRPHDRGISGAGRRKGVVPSPSSSPAKLPAKKV